MSRVRFSSSLCLSDLCFDGGFLQFHYAGSRFAFCPVPLLSGISVILLIICVLVSVLCVNSFTVFLVYFCADNLHLQPHPDLILQCVKPGSPSVSIMLKCSTHSYLTKGLTGLTSQWHFSPHCFCSFCFRSCS
jgi:hypothetical protein